MPPQIPPTVPQSPSIPPPPGALPTTAPQTHLPTKRAPKQYSAIDPKERERQRRIRDYKTILRGYMQRGELLIEQLTYSDIRTVAESARELFPLDPKDPNRFIIPPNDGTIEQLNMLRSEMKKRILE
jgi:hypothetical protein